MPSFTFNAAYSVKGHSSGHHLTGVSLVPPATSTTPYGVAFNNALTVTLESVSGTITTMRTKASENSVFAAAGILSGVKVATTVHALAAESGISTDGTIVPFSFSSDTGLRRVLKGVADVGELPYLVVGTASTWDTSQIDVAIVTIRIQVNMEGQSNASRYMNAIPDLA